MLDCPEASQQLLVSELISEGRTRDLSRTVSYHIVPPTVAAVDERGLVRPLSDGSAELVVEHGDGQVSVPIEVRGFVNPHPVSFRDEIIPILTKAGCNSGGCHGKAEGQNGFRLSIFGFDSRADFEALVLESRGRRVNPGIPLQSLLVHKGTARIPHGGGQRLAPGSSRERRLVRWITEGAMYDPDPDSSGRIVTIQIEPQQQILMAGQSQQLRVTAIDAAGIPHGVTVESQFESNATYIADVDTRGLIQAGDIPGDAAVLVRYLEHVAVCRITLPRPQVAFERPVENNFIDRLVWDKLQRLGVEPSGPADDAEFMRRVYLDTIGTLPTADEARAFFAEDSPDKRSRLIDDLLERDEYVDYWTMRWLDILRADQAKITPEGTVAMQRALRKHFSRNRPFDEFARELLTAQGNISGENFGSFYKVVTKPDELSRSFSQLFLGVRIECAQCHHHPSERWNQSDYVGLAGFFTGVSLKSIPGGGQAVLSRGGEDLPHPRSGELVAARALGAEPADFSSITDRRIALAEWMTSPDNPFFAKALANRLWAHYFGRGLIEPIDDIRDTNPPSNESLMQGLAAHLHEVGFDVKAFTRTLLTSRAYQATAMTNDSNRDDGQNFSHAAYKTLPAEVLLDAISQSTGTHEKFNGWPEGYRAIQVWDSRMPSYFFRIFGRPGRVSVCECERSDQPSIAQALHLLNAPEIWEKISHRRGRARQLAASSATPLEIIDELYLTTLTRLPMEPERALALELFNHSDYDRRAAAEDLLWSLLNTKEFLFNH